jgi:hypothetical protein
MLTSTPLPACDSRQRLGVKLQDLSRRTMIRAYYFVQVCAGEAACVGKNLCSTLSCCTDGGAMFGAGRVRRQIGGNGRGRTDKRSPRCRPWRLSGNGEKSLGAVKNADTLPRLESVVLSLTPLAGFDDRHRLGVFA